jgi:hypothetical protein
LKGAKIEKSTFTNDKDYLAKELKELNSGDTKMFSLDEFEGHLDKVLDELEQKKEKASIVW